MAPPGNLQVSVELLDTLIAVADTGGYTQASRRLAVSQPAVYQRLQRLETIVGSPVLRRKGRRVELTATGQILYQHAQEITRRFRLLEDAVARAGAPGEGASLAILVAHSLCEFPMPDICTGFRQQNPGLVVDFRVTARPSRDIDRELALGRAEVGIHTDPTPVADLLKEPFYREEYVALAYGDHRFRELDVVSARDFAGEPLIAFHEPVVTFTQGQIDGWFSRAGVEPRPIFVSNSPIAIRELVARRNGVALVPREHAAQTPNLVIRPLVDAPHRTQFFVTRVTPYEPPPTRALREYVMSRAWLGTSVGAAPASSTARSGSKRKRNE